MYLRRENVNIFSLNTNPIQIQSLFFVGTSN